jgi:hypothetical protein
MPEIDKEKTSMTHEEMLEEAERREEKNDRLFEVAKDIIDAYNPKATEEEIAKLDRNARIDAAIQEIWYIVQGGQDGREYANSILFIIKVLESLK